VSLCFVKPTMKLRALLCLYCDIKLTGCSMVATVFSTLSFFGTLFCFFAKFFYFCFSSFVSVTPPLAALSPPTETPPSGPSHPRCHQMQLLQVDRHAPRNISRVINPVCCTCLHVALSSFLSFFLLSSAFGGPCPVFSLDHS